MTSLRSDIGMTAAAHSGPNLVAPIRSGLAS
jgi:hypothetical protein